MIYNYEKLEADIAFLMYKFPYITCNVIGKSIMKRNIYELRFGNGKKNIHFNAAFHANEWITSLVLMIWFHEILTYKNTSSIMGWLENTSISLVPMVNPDGVELLHIGPKAAKRQWNVEEMNHHKPDFCGWKANIRGVDLNKQFPANWDQYKKNTYCKEPHYRDYPGYAPLTEPEAVTMKCLVEHNCFERVIALHTQGKEFYWGYKNCEPTISMDIAREFEKVSGYKGIREIDSHAGFRDWFIQTYKKSGFTLELGKGINPLPISQLKSIYSETAPLLNAAIYM